MPGAQTHQWRVLDSASLRMRLLDEQQLVFNELTGDTHLLSFSGQELLSVLAASSPQAWTSAALSQALLGESDAALEARITQNLNYLEQLGLIEQLPS